MADFAPGPFDDDLTAVIVKVVGDFGGPHFWNRSRGRPLDVLA